MRRYPVNANYIGEPSLVEPDRECHPDAGITERRRCKDCGRFFSVEADYDGMFPKDTQCQPCARPWAVRRAA